MTKLEATLDRWNVWLADKPQVGALLDEPATHEELETLGRSLSLALPESLRELLAWRDGERKGSRLFDALLRERLADSYAAFSERKRARLLSHLAIARITATEAALDSAQSGEHSRYIQPGQANAELVPFGRIPVSREEATALTDGDWLVAVDTLHQSVWLFEVGGEEIEDLVFVAPSIADLFDELLALATSGRIVIPITNGKISDVVVPPSVRAAASLLAALSERQLVAVAPHADVDELVERIATSLEMEPEARAISEVLAVLDEDESFEEIFAGDEELRALVRSFV